MEEARQKNSEDLAKTVGRMEEALEEENNSKLRKYFLLFSKKILEEWKKLGKKIHKTWQKLWKSWKNGRSCERRK